MAIISIDDRFRTGKVYTIRQAADLASVSPGTVRNWLYGTTTTEGYEMSPIFGDKKGGIEETARVSFLELAELIVVARFRKVRIKLQRIRDAHSFARREWDLAYPFAHLNLTSIGGHVLREFQEEVPGQGRFVVLSAPNQYVLPGIVENELERFDYSDADRFVTRWHPYGRDIPVVVDPHYGGGKPTIAGRGVSVEILCRRWKAGESFASIARDFRLRPPEVEAVLQRVA